MNSLYKNASIAFIVSLLTIIAVGFFAIRLNSLEDSADKKRARTKQTLSLIDTTFSYLKDAETAERGFLITGDEAYLEPFHTSKTEIPKVLPVLDELIEDTRDQQTRFNKLSALIENENQILEKRIRLKRDQGIIDVPKELKADIEKADMDAIRKLVADMETDEQAYLDEQIKRYEELADLSTLVIVAGSILAFIVVSISAWVTLQDIKRRQQLETALTVARDKAEDGARAKSEFLANMSHEIRAPMNGVIGMTGLLLDTQLSQDQYEFACTIRSSADALLTVLNDILDFSKIEAGKLTFEKVDFDLRSTIEGAVELLAQHAQGKGLEIATYFDENVPAFVKGDAGRLRQVLTNLLGNAIKFTAKGEVIVSVMTEKNEEDFATLNFSVRDTGIGIPPEVQKRLFQPFSQADSSTMRKYGGTGLGLAISKQIVELFGGEIKLESAVGVGSTFSFSLQLQKQQNTTLKIKLGQERLQNVKVMIIDDREVNQKIIHHQASSWGMRTERPKSCSDALKILKEAQNNGDAFELLLLDMNMPEMNGLELAARVRADPTITQPKIIMMTSLAGIDRDAISAASIAACLTKPVKQAALLETVLGVLENKIRVYDAVKMPTLAKRPPKAARVLVVEDNKVNQNVAVGFLEKLGYRPDIAANGMEALAATAKIPYDIIFMDCHMPEMDGYEATKRIRIKEGLNRKVFIVAMTANALEGDRDKCIASGMDDYISKPIKIELIEQVIEGRKV